MNSRRDFLQKITGGLIILNLPTSNSAKAEQISSLPYDGPILRVAVMGLGVYGKKVADGLQESKLAKLTGLISGSPDKLSNWQSKYKVAQANCYNHENFDSIKDNPEIDAVYVTTPNALHHDQVIRIAKAGKHVICEKPMAISSKEGNEMIEACNKANVKLLVGYRMHFEANTLEVVKMRKEGKLGKVLFFQGLCGFKIGDPKQWRLNKTLSGGGSMMDIGIYALNGARYMVGEEPIWVTAQETKTDNEKFKEGIDETIQFQMGFPSGAVASCLSTYNMNHLDRFFLTAEKGFAELQPASGYGPIEGKTNKGKLNNTPLNHQTVQMDEMAGIILKGNQPVIPVDGYEAVKDLKIIEAIYKAVKTGKKVKL